MIGIFFVVPSYFIDEDFHSIVSLGRWRNGAVPSRLDYQTRMPDEQLLARVAVDPNVCAGRPFIRGTRICLTVILDALTQGLSPEDVTEHYPCLEAEDLHAALAYASWLAEKNGGLAMLGRNPVNDPFQPL